MKHFAKEIADLFRYSFDGDQAQVAVERYLENNAIHIMNTKLLNSMSPQQPVPPPPVPMAGTSIMNPTSFRGISLDSGMGKMLAREENLHKYSSSYEVHISTKCTCGSTKLGMPRHSSWCDKYDKEDV
jgi:hypothetical protein